MTATPHHFTATAQGWSDQGYGIVHHPDGRVVFVPGLWPDETAQIEIVEWHERYGQGRIIELSSAHPMRVAPRCPHHGTGLSSCTGCSWQGFDYTAQCQAKQARLSLLLPAFSDAIRDIIPASQIWGYRRRAQLKTNGVDIGYVNQYSRDLAAIDDCVVLSDRNRRTLAELKTRLPAPDWAGDQLTSLDIDEALQVDTVSVNQRRDFHQAHDGQNKIMGSWLKSILGQGTWRHGLELFCGDGNFTRHLSVAGLKEVYALDSGGSAIAALRGRHLRGVTAHICDLSDLHQLRARLGAQWGRSQLLLLDPPRAGYRPLTELLGHFPHLRDIIYISCDPFSFARDTHNLAALNFSIAEIQPIDIFPHTPHIELMSWFRRTL